MASEQPALISGRRQPLPGAASVQVCPFEGRPSLLTSNSHVLSGGEMIVVIDPGADPRQARRVSDGVAECLREKRLPVLVLLTHCHRDHVRETHKLQVDEEPLVVAHAVAARALAVGDRALTMAEIFDEEAPRCDVQIALFPPNATVRSLPLPGGRELSVTPVAPGPETGGLRAERLRIGDESLLILHTPGHSPDSISALAGGVLFCGDLAVAARPLVAGIAGWDRLALVASLRGALSLLRGGCVSTLATGHGYSLCATDAVRVLERTLATAESLGDLERVDSARVHQLADYTRTLVGEIGDAVSVIAGRLDTAAFHLEALQEKKAAAEALLALDVETVDGVLDSFREHLGAVLDGRSAAISLPHKGMATIVRLDGVLGDPVLADYVSPLLLRRTRRMMTDFIHMMYGVRQPAPLRSAALPVLVREACELARTAGRQEGDLDATVQDEASFAKALGRRIVQQPVAAGVETVLELPDDLPPVEVEPERLVDLLAGLLELLAAQGAGRAVFSAAATEGALRLTVAAAPSSAVVELESRRLRYFDIVLRVWGGACRREGERVLFDLPLSSTGKRA
jgi:glyoxylase-like metal-dependent hydrolase (beta-lactamase superfamily II)